MHTASRFPLERFNNPPPEVLLWQWFQWFTWNTQLEVPSSVTGASLQPKQYAAPQQVILPSYRSSHLIKATSRTKKGRISDQIQQPEPGCFRVSATTNCSVRHLFREAGKHRQHKPNYYRMCFFTINGFAFSRPKVLFKDPSKFTNLLNNSCKTKFFCM